MDSDTMHINQQLKSMGYQYSKLLGYQSLSPQDKLSQPLDVINYCYKIGCTDDFECNDNDSDKRKAAAYVCSLMKILNIAALSWSDFSKAMKLLLCKMDEINTLSCELARDSQVYVVPKDFYDILLKELKHDLALRRSLGGANHPGGANGFIRPRKRKGIRETQRAEQELSLTKPELLG